MEKLGITVVGAGVIGLAVALELSKEYPDIFIVEKELSFGQGISSRNSEVIHAGIYYPKDSLKAKTCVEGKERLYDFCAKNNIGHKRTGKLIVAIDKSEVRELEGLFRRGLGNGVEDLRLLSKEDIKGIEPHVEAEAAIYSPSTGILDSHGLMKTLAAQFADHKGSVVYGAEVVGIDRVNGGYEVTAREGGKDVFKFFTRVLINSAGLDSDTIAARAGLEKNEYALKYCKGDYLRVRLDKARLIGRLVYPVPKEDRAGLGIHATLDLSGGLRLGPDDEYVDKIDYHVDPKKIEIFYESTRKFLPFIHKEDLAPDTSGIRPKLQGKGEAFRDFIVKDETDNGFPGLVDLIGIESPGLTSALAIAKIVKDIVSGI